MSPLWRLENCYKRLKEGKVIPSKLICRRPMILDVGAMLLIFGACAYSATPTVFASLPLPNGLAATQNFLLATSQANTSEISKIDTTETLTHFTTLPSPTLPLHTFYR